MTEQDASILVLSVFLIISAAINVYLFTEIQRRRHKSGGIVNITGISVPHLTPGEPIPATGFVANPKFPIDNIIFFGSKPKATSYEIEIPAAGSKWRSDAGEVFRVLEVSGLTTGFAHVKFSVEIDKTEKYTFDPKSMFLYAMPLRAWDALVFSRSLEPLITLK